MSIYNWVNNELIKAGQLNDLEKKKAFIKEQLFDIIDPKILYFEAVELIEEMGIPYYIYGRGDISQYSGDNNITVSIPSDNDSIDYTYNYFIITPKKKIFVAKTEYSQLEEFLPQYAYYESVFITQSHGGGGVVM